MRELNLKLIPNKFVKKLWGKMFDYVERSELIEVVKLDYEKSTKIILIGLTLKEGYKIEDVEFPETTSILEIFDKKGRTYTCLMKGKAKKKYFPFTSKIDIDLIWKKPTYVTKNLINYTVIGDQKNLNKIVNFFKFFGEIESMSFKKPNYNDKNKTFDLTEKQKEILRKAKEMGYYEYPKKVTSEKLSKELGIKRSTLIEHLRRIEKKIIDGLEI